MKAHTGSQWITADTTTPNPVIEFLAAIAEDNPAARRRRAVNLRINTRQRTAERDEQAKRHFDFSLVLEDAIALRDELTAAIARREESIATMLQNEKQLPASTPGNPRGTFPTSSHSQNRRGERHEGAE